MVIFGSLGGACVKSLNCLSDSKYRETLYCEKHQTHAKLIKILCIIQLQDEYIVFALPSDTILVSSPMSGVRG